MQKSSVTARNITLFGVILVFAGCATTGEGKLGAQAKLAVDDTAAPVVADDTPGWVNNVPSAADQPLVVQAPDQGKAAPQQPAPAAKPSKLVFKLGRTDDGTTTFVIAEPSGATVVSQEVRGNKFVAIFEVPGHGRYTWKMRKGEFLNRRYKGETITVALGG